MAALLIDVGNTRIKWARFTDGRLGAARAAAHATWTVADYARRLTGTARDVTSILVSSVAGPAVERALRQAARRARVPIRFVAVPARGGGIRVAYPEPWRLGVDRFVGMVGAHALFRGVPLCVAGVGTALTVDLITREGRHVGGAIIPAPSLMVETLLSRTYGIRRRARGAAKSSAGLFARATREAIAQGARYAAAALIDRAVAEAASRLGRLPLVVLTGGGAAPVRALLVTHCVGVPDLVLRGLSVLQNAAPRPLI
jgi:type III pantothenate kinase